MTTEYLFAPLKTGVRLAYMEQGPREGLPVVMLHGISDSCRSFDLVRPHLPSAWRVFALTLRGHGLSDKPEAGYDMAVLASDVKAFLDAVGVRRAILVGHSLSTAVTLATAAAYPERVAGFVLIGAFASPAANPAIAELNGALASFDDHGCGAAFAREFQESTLANPIPPEFLDLAVSESLRMPTHAWRGVAEGFSAFDPLAAAARASAPATIIWGDRDAYCPHADQLALRDALHSARFLRLEDVGHAVHWERPAETAALLRAFIGELDSADEVTAREAAYG